MNFKTFCAKPRIDGVSYNTFLISFSLSDTTVTGSISVFADRFIGHGFLTVTENPELRSTLTVFTVTTPAPETSSLFLIGLGVSGLAIKLKRSRRARSLGDV